MLKKKKNHKKLFYYLVEFIVFFSIAISSENIYAQDSFHIATYITGIGCPHCSNVAPKLLKEKVNECKDILIIEYEIYKQPQNASVILEFNNNYKSGLGIPQVIFNKENILIGDKQINSNIDVRCNDADKNEVCLPNGNCVSWEDFNLNDLPLYPRIWGNNRIAIKTEDITISNTLNDLIKSFLRSEDPTKLMKEKSGLITFTSSIKIEISGGNVEFKNAAIVDGWLLQWNGNTQNVVSVSSNKKDDSKKNNETRVSIMKTITLALADSVNPCAIAILIMMLIAIVTYNPGDKKIILVSGLSFILAVLIMYFLYGILIVKFFDIIQSFKTIQAVITPILSLIMGIFSLILGILETKDFISYKEGSFGTEMPLKLRPKVQKLIAKVTSPTGAFILGLFVTIFLLPCTIGPYFILGGLISTGSTNITQILPYLLLYNLIFILPMLLITGIISLGLKNIDDIKDWKDKNVRILHLIAGILLVGLATWVFIENIPIVLGILKIT